MNCKIAVCDDDLYILNNIPQKIIGTFNNAGFTASCNCYDNSADLFADIQSGSHYDVIFMDVDLKTSDGIDDLVQIRENGCQIPVVFLSNREDRVFDSFFVKPIYFLRKSLFDEEIDDAVRLVIRNIEQKDESAVIFSDGVHSYKISGDDILYLEITDQLLSIHLTNQTISLRYSMNQAETLLEKQAFFRCHKSFLVNLKHIFSIQREEILLDNQTLIPLSRRKYTELKQKMLKYVQEEMAIERKY